MSNGKISDAILRHDQLGYKQEDEVNINGRHYYQELVLDPEQPVKTINDFVVELGVLYIDNDVLRRTAVIEHFKAYLKEQNFCFKFYFFPIINSHFFLLTIYNKYIYHFLIKNL